MSKVALIQPYNYPSMPVRLLHGVLHDKGHQPVSIFFKRHRLDRMGPPSDAEYELLFKTIDELDPLFVGLSLRSTFATVAQRIARRLRQEGRIVVWGGTHATVAPEECIPDADAVCVGEGEGALVDIAERLAAGDGDLSDIPNLWARKKGEVEGEVVKNPQRPLIQDLDSVAWPWYQPDNCYYIEDEKVSYALPAGIMTSYDLMTSRGCPYRCDFCCHSVLVDTYRGLGRYMRRRSPESVVKELESAVERFPTVNRVRFWDDVFPAVNRAWLVEFSELYRKRIGLPFWCYTYPSLSHPEILTLLKNAGMRYFGMGIQSGSHRIRKDVFARPDKTEDIVQAAKNFKEFKVHPEFDLICDNPFETEADFQEALDLLLRLPRPFSLFQHSLTYFPNYPLTALALEKGYIKPEDVEHLSGKSFRQWHDEFSHARKPEHIFWITIFYLTQFRFAPRGLIRALSRSGFFRRHPVLLNSLVKPFGRVAEKTRYTMLYMRERGVGLTLGRFIKKLFIMAKDDSAGARAVWGAD